MFAVRRKPEFQCDSCIKREMQAQRGCEKPAPIPYWTDRDGESRNRCPRRPIFENPDWYNRIVHAYNFFKAGHLPHAGGMMDQHALYPFVMSTLEDVISECDRIEMEEANRKKTTTGGDTINLLERR